MGILLIAVRQELVKYSEKYQRVLQNNSKNNNPCFYVSNQNELQPLLECWLYTWNHTNQTIFVSFPRYLATNLWGVVSGSKYFDKNPHVTYIPERKWSIEIYWCNYNLLTTYLTKKLLQMRWKRRCITLKWF